MSHATEMVTVQTQVEAKVRAKIEEEEDSHSDANNDQENGEENAEFGPNDSQDIDIFQMFAIQKKSVRGGRDDAT